MHGECDKKAISGSTTAMRDPLPMIKGREEPFPIVVSQLAIIENHEQLHGCADNHTLHDRYLGLRIFLENGRNQKRHKQNRNTLRKVSESGNDDGRLVEVIDESFDKRELVD